MKALAMLAASGNEPVDEYVDDVFSVDSWTGTGTTLRVNNGVKLSSRGGLVMFCDRTRTDRGWVVYDTLSNDGSAPNPGLYALSPSGSGVILATDEITYMNSSSRIYFDGAGGYSLGTDTAHSVNNYYTTSKYVGISFRRARRFFDVLTYSLSTPGSVSMPHALNCAVGMVWIKQTDGSGVNANWATWHRGSGSHDAVAGPSLSSSVAAPLGFMDNPPDTSTAFLTGNVIGWDGSNVTSVSQPGNYTAYVFAHDPTPEGKIFCSAFTSNASGVATVPITWGEPQLVMLRKAVAAGDWTLHDTTRGMPYNAASRMLRINSQAAEAASITINATYDGFTVSGLTANTAYNFMAVRMSNKPPSSALEVYMPQLRTGNGVATILPTDPGFNSNPEMKPWSPDMVLSRRTNSTTDGMFRLWDRKRGDNNVLPLNATTTAAALANSISFDDFRGMRLASAAPNVSGAPFIIHSFKRAAKFLDILTWTGTGSSRAVQHRLGTLPAWVIVRRLTTAGNWRTTISAWGAGVSNGIINGTSAFAAPGANYFGYSDTYLEMDTGADVNASGSTYQAFLFGRLPGVTKDGIYWGTGTPLTFDCGFTAGARFVLIKPIDIAGGWHTFDTARGIGSGTESVLDLNSTAIESAGTAQLIDPHPSGFTVVAPDYLTSGVAYCYFAIA